MADANNQVFGTWSDFAVDQDLAQLVPEDFGVSAIQQAGRNLRQF
jgi:hypothetical protein